MERAIGDAMERAVRQSLTMSMGDPRILVERPISEVKRAAKEQGMRSLRDSGLLSIFDGITTVEEVLRETIDIM